MPLDHLVCCIVLRKGKERDLNFVGLLGVDSKLIAISFIANQLIVVKLLTLD